MAAEKELARDVSDCPGSCQNGDVSESRRKLLRKIGWGAFFATIAAATAGSMRFFFPRVLFEPPTTFKIGKFKDYPGGIGDDYGVVTISEKFMESQRVWIVRETDKIYAIFGKCTHLGCTPKWFPNEKVFKCPCHGSRYYSNGVNFAGPAPRPMDRFAISTLEDGRIVVDKGEVFTIADFDNPRAFLKA